MKENFCCNKSKEIIVDGNICIEFETVGKYKFKCIVDKKLWDDYLKTYRWTGSENRYGLKTVKTSIKGVTYHIDKIICENEYEAMKIYQGI